MGRKKLTQEEVITQFENISHELDSFEKVNYLGTYTKVTITCKIHGYYEITPKNYKRGSRCAKCSGNHSHTTVEAIEILNKQPNAHLDDFSSVEYTGTADPITLRCIKHDHLYSTTFGDYTYHHCRCPICAWTNKSETSKIFDSYKCYIIKCDEYGETFSKLVDASLQLRNVLIHQN